MPLIAQTNQKINCSAAQAYSVVSDMERFGQWFPAVISISSSDELPQAQVGKKYLETVSIPLRGERQIELTVKESVQNKRFVTEGEFPPPLPRMEIVITELGADQIMLQWSMFSRNESAAAKMLLLPLAKRIMQKRANLGAERLKNILEESMV